MAHRRSVLTPLAGPAVVAAVAFAACGGGDGGSGGSAVEPVTLTAYSGSVAQLLDDTLRLDYTIDMPEGFTVSEFASDSNVVWEDPDVEFGVAEISVRLTWTPVTYDAATLEADALVISDDRQILDSGTDDTLSFVTFATPSESSGDIFSAHAQTARLVDGTNLLCSATWSIGIEDSWSDDDVTTAATQALDICRTYAAV